MKHILLATLATVLIASCSAWGDYESVEGDPMKARIYTLDNGLRVYLTVNKDEPRIQTYIAVRTGSRNDPAESTGLAHYLEHLMFKGTTSFGTLDYEKERPLLDSIEALYAHYATLTDTAARRQLYHRIDSFSNVASRYAIANEYDKLMAGIGSKGSNAYTSTDVTCYTEDIPSNQVEQWARVQADRFQDMVIRGFHTELEAVYEEYNISRANDFEKLYEAMNLAMFPHHPYGTQTTIGTQEHLKNPSLRNVWDYYHQWYVPDNIAICMSGDLDPDETMKVIKKYFGKWQRSQGVPEISFPAEEELKAPVVRDVYGQEAEFVAIGWRLPGRSDRSHDLLQVTGELLNNDHAGLLDVDLNQQQLVQESAAFVEGMTDYSQLLLIAYPKEGQTLDEARQLLTLEVEKLRNGKWDEELLSAIQNNMRLDKLRRLQYNSRRANEFVEAFIAGIDWKDKVGELDRMEQLTKEDIIGFARQYLTDGYVCVYKHQGTDPDSKKIDKPQISPIETNRDHTSPFVTDVLSMPTRDIEPEFTDFKRDFEVIPFAGLDEMVYKQDKDARLFSLTITFERGQRADNMLPIAADYLKYLGTEDLSADQYQRRLYQLACDVSTRVGRERTTVTLSGLAENMAEALNLYASHLYTCRADSAIYANVVRDELKERAMSKLNQGECFRRLQSYATYGPVNPLTDIPSAERLTQTDPAELLNHLRDLAAVQGRILYYGPMPQQEVLDIVTQQMQLSDDPQEPAVDNTYRRLPVTEADVLVAPYDAKNIYMQGYSNNGETYDPILQPDIDLFNEYFGGGMNSVVFQELRESRGLAYSARAFYYTADRLDDTNAFTTYIITQTDKMDDCIDVFDHIVEDMPEGEKAFDVARESIIKRLSTTRRLREHVLDYYVQCRDLGLDHDPDIDTYNRVSGLTLTDLADFHHQHVKGRTYRHIVLGNEAELDMDRLMQMGPVRRLTLTDIFGY